MKRIIYILAILVIYSCGKTKQETETTHENAPEDIIITKEQFAGNGMKLGKPENHTFYNYVTANGFIDVPPQNKAGIHTYMAGYIKQSPLLVGNHVKKGDLLLTLENPEYVSLQQRYMEVFQQLAYLKSEYQRQQKLYDENISSEKVYLKAKSEYDVAEATYKGLKEQLRLMNINPAWVEKGNITSVISIYAPITGTISKLDLSIGSYVSPTDELLEIVNNDHLHLELSVFEKDILKIAEEMPVTFQVNEVSDRSYKATVHLVGNTLSENKTISIHGHINNEKELNFKVGMYVNAHIITDSIVAAAIPKTAVSKEGENLFAYVLEKEDNVGYHFKKLPLKKMHENESYYEVPENTLTQTLLVVGAGGL